ncbi:DUF1990 family protein [Streptomyces sp. NPDC054838]
MTRLMSTGSAGRGTLSYPERGATEHRPLPDGYHHLHHRTRIGHGQAVFEAAGTAVTTFRAHRTSGMRIRAEAGAVRPGARVTVGIGFGPLRIDAPCLILRTAYESARVGFAYGTLVGHPESGEESFMVLMDPDGTVWFEVTAFSRPARWYTRLGGPVVPFLQLSYARLLGRTVRKLAAGAATA